MSRSHSAELLLLLGLSMSASACDDDGGDKRDEVDAAVDVCIPVADLLERCYGEESESYFLAFVGSCVYQLGSADYQGPDCRAAQEDYFACMGAAECKDLKSEDDPCEEESDLVEEKCEYDDASEGDGDEG